MRSKETEYGTATIDDIPDTPPEVDDMKVEIKGGYWYRRASLSGHPDTAEPAEGGERIDEFQVYIKRGGQWHEVDETYLTPEQHEYVIETFMESL